jgi:predicted acylesterase/phospholipase RssA
MGLLGKIFSWLFVRTPKKFSLPFLASLLLNAFFATLLMELIDGKLYESMPDHESPPRKVLHAAILTLTAFVLLFLLIVVSYIVGLIVFKLLRRRKPLKKIEPHPPKLPNFSPAQETKRTNPFEEYDSIGIILAGGGAKGAYQAGAMKAIYDFLDHYNAHHKVKMIAGTSIGAWNALFWLANLVNNPEEGGKGLLEEWWSNVGVEDIVDPILYWPFLQNYLLSNKPWQDTFQRFFVKNKAAHDRLLDRLQIQKPDAEGTLHFYLTRTNVARAKPEFVTNVSVAEIENIKEEYLHTSSVNELLDMHKLATSVEDIGEAVFSSMDLPPLFEYTKIGDSHYEDGGVVDNLPIRFGTDVERCDLLFVLPLNASFAEEPNIRSIMQRVLRVMNVRQGVLERHSFKRIYRRNELTALRNELMKLRNQAQRADQYEKLLEQLQEQTEKLRPQFGETIEPFKKVFDEFATVQNKEPRVINKDRKNEIEASRVKRLINHQRKKVQVFAICPTNLSLNTGEFWKTAEAGLAFRRMYDITWRELRKFNFSADPDVIRIGHVNPLGEVSWKDDI